MQPLNLPEFSPILKQESGKNFILDKLRRKYVALTPEEWVRQHFINFLVVYKNYPQGCTGNEISLSLNGLKKRCDTVIYDKKGAPLLIAEYKAPSVNITQEVFDQISLYNLVMKVPYLIVSNGINHYCCRMDYVKRSYCFLQDIPDYNEIVSR